jgi:predicted phosphodiesterase
MSDLHLGHLKPKHKQAFMDTLTPTACDYLILAGDITHDYDDVLEMMDRTKADDCVYINGNHEYYTKGPQAGMDTYGDENIVAATMWFPHDTNPIARGAMNDFRFVTPEWCFETHREHMEFLHAHRREVIVTHHLPHEDSIAPRYKRMLTNQYFLAPDAWEELKPKLWIHGHTHTSMDYSPAPGKRIVCNPRGYHSENKQFNPNLVIEI